MTRQLGKLRVVANQDTNGAAIGFNGSDTAATGDIPPIGFVRRGVNLGLREHLSVSQEDIGNIANPAVLFLDRRGATDNVDVVPQGQIAHQVAERFGIFRHRFDGFRRGPFTAFNGQQLQREQLREHHEITFVGGHHIHKVPDDVAEFFKRCHPALLVLDRADPNGVGHSPAVSLALAVVAVAGHLGIPPGQVDTVTQGSVVSIQVVRNNAVDFKTVV